MPVSAEAPLTELYTRTNVHPSYSAYVSLDLCEVLFVYSVLSGLCLPTLTFLDVLDVLKCTWLLCLAPLTPKSDYILNCDLFELGNNPHLFTSSVTCAVFAII